MQHTCEDCTRRIMEMLDRHCEKFLGGPSQPYRERVHVTLDHKGKIFLNANAHRKMGEPEAVYLYYNRPKDMIVLEPADPRSAEMAFTLQNGQNSARIVWANPFCKHFKIRVEGTIKFIEPTMDSDRRMYLKLSETVNLSRGPRKRIKSAQGSNIGEHV